MQEPYSRRTSEGPSSFLTYHAWLTCYFCLDFQTPGIRTYCFGRSQGIFQFSSHNCNVLITTFCLSFLSFLLEALSLPLVVLSSKICESQNHFHLSFLPSYCIFLSLFLFSSNSVFTMPSPETTVQGNMEF